VDLFCTYSVELQFAGKAAVTSDLDKLFLRKNLNMTRNQCDDLKNESQHQRDVRRPKQDVYIGSDQGYILG
jgi:hypothetical protein